MAKSTTKTNRLDEIKAQLIHDMNTAGVDASPYGIALEMAAQTLLERERAYNDYLEHGAKQITEKGTTNPYAVRLTSWNSQARSWLSTLKLTPVRAPATDTPEAGEQ